MPNTKARIGRLEKAMKNRKDPVARPKTNRPRGLTPKQERFVLEYMIDLNATQAYIRAGYSQRTANKNATQLMVNQGISEAIAAAKAKLAASLGITLEDWLSEHKIIGFSDIANHIEIEPETGAIRARAFEDMPGHSRRAIESITEVRSIHESADGKQVVVNSRLNFKLHSKLGSLEQIGKHCGFLKDKIEHTGKDGGPIDHNVNVKLTVVETRG